LTSGQWNRNANSRLRFGLQSDVIAAPLYWLLRE